MTDLNLPSKVRAALYVILMIGAPIVAYCQIKGFIGTAEVGLWTALTVAVAGLARLNVSPD